jgi:hypothetical protein
MMRAKVQERRRPKLAEFSFILPEFKKLNRDDAPRGLAFAEQIGHIEKAYLNEKTA